MELSLKAVEKEWEDMTLVIPNIPHDTVPVGAGDKDNRVVEAATSVTDPLWSAVSTNTLAAGSSYFSDPQWASFPTRFYRIRSP